MKKVRRDVMQRYKCKSAVSQLRMGDNKMRPFKYYVSKKEDVDIDDPLAPLFVAFPAQPFLDRQDVS